MREKVKVYPNRNGISVRGSEWTLWFRKVKTKDGKTMYVVKPLQPHYNPENQSFHYEDLKSPIWLDSKEFGEFITAVVRLRDMEI